MVVDKIHSVLSTKFPEFVGKDQEYRIFMAKSGITADTLTKAIKKYYRDENLGSITIINPDTKTEMTVEEFVAYIDVHGLDGWDSGEAD